MPKDYHRVLGLPPTASMAEIKRAYRDKAKEYHPDRNEHPRAEEAFVLVNEAYVYLSDPTRLEQVKRQRSRSHAADRRATAYSQWHKKEREKARKDAERNASTSFDEFSKSKIYRAAMVLNNVYNYVFIIMGALMILMPIFGAIFSDETEEDIRYSAVIFPVIIGAGFIYAVWYFTIHLEREEQES